MTEERLKTLLENSSQEMSDAEAQIIQEYLAYHLSYILRYRNKKGFIYSPVSNDDFAEETGRQMFKEAHSNIRKKYRDLKLNQLLK